MLAPSESKMETRSTRDRIGRYGPLILCMFLISYASSDEFSAANTSRVIRPLLVWLFPNISEESIGLAHFVARKAAHLIEYAVLAWLAARAFTGSSRVFLRQRWVLCSLVLVAVYALVDEYRQSLVSSRTGSIYDSGIDIVGGLIGLVGYAFLSRRATPDTSGEKPVRGS
jgi:VanZ family protein